MAWPNGVLPVLVELFDGSNWLDITDDVRGSGNDGQITIRRGFPNESSRPEPGSITMTLDNRTGRYTPRNPTSDLYGKIGRNTPIRVRVGGELCGAEHMLIEGTSGTDQATTPDASALHVTGDIDIRIDAAMDTWASATLAGRYVATGDNRSWAFAVTSDGKLSLAFSALGTSASVVSMTSTAAAGLTDGSRKALRVTLDVDNGGVHTATFYTADTIDGTWVQLGSVVNGADPASIFAGTAPLEVGQVAAFNTSAKTGKVYAFQLLNGIGGTTVANPDFRTVEPTATTFTDDTGLDWTLGGDTRLFDPGIRGVAEVSEWPPRWDVSGQDATTTITAQGILRRLGQGRKPVWSPMRSGTLNVAALLANDVALAAYFPMEDGTDAASFASALAGGTPLTWTGDAPDRGANGVAILSSDRVPVLGSTTALAGSVAPYTPHKTIQWAVSMVLDVPDSPAWADGTPILWVHQSTAGSNTATWELRYRTGAANFQLRALGADGSQVGSATAFGALPGGDQYWLYVQIRRSGSDGQMTGVLYSIDDDGNPVDNGGPLAVVTGCLPNPATSIEIAPQGGLDGLAVGHVTVTDSNYFALAVETGTILIRYKGEAAGDRASRLCDEIGVPVTLVGDAADTMAMGPQTIPSTFIDNLTETHEADLGLLFESRDRLGLAWRGRVTLYNQAPALTLDYNEDGEIAPDLEPIDDDQNVRNKVTVGRRSGDTTGSSATYEDSTSRMGTGDPPDGVGAYEDTVELNLVDDSRLLDIAAWMVHVGTWDESRYPRVVIDQAALAAQGKSDLVASAASLDVGARLQLLNLPVWAAGGTADLMAMGFTETFTYPNGWTITLG